MATMNPVLTGPLAPELLHRIDAYWRAANYLSVSQLYLCDNPLLKKPLERRCIARHGQDMPEIVIGTWGDPR